MKLAKLELQAAKEKERGWGIWREHLHYLFRIFTRGAGVTYKEPRGHSPELISAEQQQLELAQDATTLLWVGL